jgi:hypothetical protein
VNPTLFIAGVILAITVIGVILVWLNDLILGRDA